MLQRDLQPKPDFDEWWTIKILMRGIVKATEIVIRISHGLICGAERERMRQRSTVKDNLKRDFSGRYCFNI